MTDVVDPRALTIQLGGKWQRSYGTAPCPVCQPEKRKDQNALTIGASGDRLLLNCKKLNCSFADLLAACSITPGSFEVDHEALAKMRAERIDAEQKALARARSLWELSAHLGGTKGEAYLRGRGITCDLPISLRWIHDIYHKPTGRYQSAMVAMVEHAAGLPMGIHRTFFDKQGVRLKGGSAKMMLGRVSGGAVRLTQPGGPLVVSEGIETGLSLASGLLSGPHEVWAALSTSGMKNLALPREPHKLIIGVDAGSAGISAGNVLAENADAQGWDVSILAPPGDVPDGTDWNDVLQSGVMA